eukprot:g1693.t1
MAEQQQPLLNTKTDSAVGTDPSSVAASNEMPSHKIKISTDTNSFRDPDYVAPSSTMTPTATQNEGVFGYFRRAFISSSDSKPLSASVVAEKLGRELSNSGEKTELAATKSTGDLPVPKEPSSQSQDSTKGVVQRAQTDVEAIRSSVAVPMDSPETPLVEGTAPVSLQSESEISKAVKSDTAVGEHSRQDTDGSIVSIPDVILEVGDSVKNPVVKEDVIVTDSVPLSTNLVTEQTNKETEASSGEPALDEEDSQFVFPSKKNNKDAPVRNPADDVGEDPIDENKQEPVQTSDKNLIIDSAEQHITFESAQSSDLSPSFEQMKPAEADEGLLEEVESENEDTVKAIALQEATDVKKQEPNKSIEEEVTPPLEETGDTDDAVARLLSPSLEQGGSFKGKPVTKAPPKRSKTTAGETKQTASSSAGFFKRLFSKRGQNLAADAPEPNKETDEQNESVPEDIKTKAAEAASTPMTTELPQESARIEIQLPPENTSLNMSEVADSTDHHSGARSPLALTEVFSEPSERPQLDTGESSMKTADLDKCIADSKSDDDLDNITNLWLEQMQLEGLKPMNEDYSKKSTEFDTPLDYLLDFHAFVKSNKYTVTVLEILKTRFGEDHTLVRDFVQATKEHKEEEDDSLLLGADLPTEKDHEETEALHQMKDSASTETSSTLDTAQTSTTQKTGESSTPRKTVEPKTEYQENEAVEEAESPEAMTTDKLPESDGGLLGSHKSATADVEAQTQTTPTTTPGGFRRFLCCVFPRVNQ